MSRTLPLVGLTALAAGVLWFAALTGGQRVTPMTKLMEPRPEEVVMRAVKGMLPKTRLGRAQLKNLRVYAGAEHPHGPQQPKEVTL